MIIMMGDYATSLTAHLLVGGPIVSYEVTRFDNDLGRGDRTASITISSDLSTSMGTLENLIDGLYGTSSSDSIEIVSGQTGKYIQFNFPTAKLITGFIWYMSNGSDTSLWKLQASNDGITFLDVTTPASYNSSRSSKIAKSNGVNNGFYTIYRLTQTSGSTDFGPWSQEVEFKILDIGTIDKGSGLSPSYSNFLGTGNRMAYIEISGTTVWSGNVYTSINGNSDNSAYFNNNQTETYVEYDFGTDCLITEISWEQNISVTHGDWVWQHYDGLSWVDVGLSFTLGGAIFQIITSMSGASTYHSRYRLQQISGSTSHSPYIKQVNFKIGYPAII